jgi:hypothetical protein
MYKDGFMLFFVVPMMFLNLLTLALSVRNAFLLFAPPAPPSLVPRAALVGDQSSLAFNSASVIS